MPSHMGVQTFATARNSQVEYLVHFILEEFFTSLEVQGQVKDVAVETQRRYSSEIASDIWDHYVTAKQADGFPIEVWCQTTCYKGNGTGKPEPNKTYEVRETLVEGLSIREHFQSDSSRDSRSIHFTVGDSRYTYQWFMGLKSAIFDKSIYIGESDYDIFDDIRAVLESTLTEEDRTLVFRRIAQEDCLLGRKIKGTMETLTIWWVDEGHPESKLANSQWELIYSHYCSNSTSWPDLNLIRGQDIKGRTNNAVFGDEGTDSDPLIPLTAAKLLHRNPFLASAMLALGSWKDYVDAIANKIGTTSSLYECLVSLWNSSLPERLVIRRLLVRIHSEEYVAYIQDRDIQGITEHNLYNGEHSSFQVSEVCGQIEENLVNVGIDTPQKLIFALNERGKRILNSARWFEAKNGTQLKPSFDYAQLAVEKAGYMVKRPSEVQFRTIGYHSEITNETVRPYTNLKAILSPTGKPICLLKAKFFREQEFPRRCKEEAFVGLTLKYKLSNGQFAKRFDVPIVMLVDMASNFSPPTYAVKRLISFGWHVVFSTEELLSFLDSQVALNSE